MFFYYCGRNIKDISQLEIGKMYSVGGVCGVLTEIKEDSVYVFDNNKEEIHLQIGDSVLKDKIFLSDVFLVYKAQKARQKTIEKYLQSIKKVVK